jgi:fructan beta-fructosidase
MKSKLIYLLAGCTLACASPQKEADSVTQADSSVPREQHRPLIHFSPKEKWMNDPNGMVFYNNTYHLFYQYYPDSTVWGPMHWGHATSKDLVHWEHQPIALYPDSLGYIFSGSAVMDVNNTSGLGADGKVPMVAIFTHHDPEGEKAGRTNFQNQSIAYSLDEGRTWTKYAGNPVLKNPGIKDFRDPKVSWHEDTKKWIMTLATLDRITFYSSPDLKNWTKESEFGKEFGAHGGVWECPDLFALDHNGEKVWVLLVSINPGGPNGGSATQYFTGRFDGKTFTPFQTDTRWIDYGPDNYAGVTWSNTGDRTIFIGWMSNWQYATMVPTEKWRSAMTVPRELGLEKVGEQYFITSRPVAELDALAENTLKASDLQADDLDVNTIAGTFNGPARLQFTADKIAPFSITFSNAGGQQVVVGFDHQANQYYMDRSASGKKDFEAGFAIKHTAPRISLKENVEVTLIIDNASIEMFADNGLTAMTQIFFPDSLYSKINIKAGKDFKISSLQYSRLKPAF